MIQVPPPVGAVLLVVDVLAMSLCAIAAIRESGPRERGRHRAPMMRRLRKHSS